MLTREPLPQTDFDAIEQALPTLRATAAIAEERVKRLLRTAFREPQIVEKFREQIRLRGQEAATSIVEGTHTLPRALWLGRLRGGVFNPAAREEAKMALSQLRPAVAELEQRQDQVRDLERARETLLVERDRTQTREQVIERRQDRDQSQERDPARDKGRDRERERS